MPELRNYQKDDVQKLITHPAMGVFNEQRTGKTPTALMTMRNHNVNKLLIVCPASAQYQWAAECLTWLAGQGLEDFRHYYVYRLRYDL